uniref:Glutamate receptor 1 n=1 Tax=Scolopendra viridis TaxID=118503 RepID=A0A4D5RB87_SCOVI
MSLWVRAWVLLGLGVVNIIAERQMLIGGLFDDSSQSNILEVAFKAAINKVNSNPALLPERKLKPVIEYIYKDDSYYASQRVCAMVRTGVVAIFGPQSETTASHVQSMCDVFEIPHIETRWDYRFIREEYSVNVHPYPPALASIYVKLIEKFDWWVNFCILYQDDAGLVRVQELLKMAKKNVNVIVFQLDKDHDHRSVLKHLMLKEIHHLVIDCNIDILYEVLKQAQQVGMMTASYDYFITNLDFQTLDLEDFQYSGANITGFGLVDFNKTEVKTIISEWTLDEIMQQNLKEHSEKSEADRHHEATWKQLAKGIIPTEAALVYDAVILFATAVTNLDRRGIIEAQSLHCNSTSFWNHGSSIKNYIKHVQLHNKTMSGFVGLNSGNGFRELFTLDILHLTSSGLQKVGMWHKKPGSDQYAIDLWWNLHIEKSQKNMTKAPHYRVATKKGEPYFVEKKDSSVLKGNDQYEGYVVELVTELSKILNFTFEIYAAPNDAYGKKLDNGTWDGMIGEVVYNRSDMALADLTITTTRQEVVDFSTPFINLGISILFKKPQKEPPALFSFLDPFSIEVWLYMSAAYIGVSIILFVLARFSPYEWDNPYPCIQEPEELENNFSLMNSLWFTIGSLMQQGSDIAPRAVSTRIVAGMWWFFTLIIISSYTANLAAFLTVETLSSPIENVNDLAKQTKIKYGCLKSGSTRKFFETATLEPYVKMWKFMSANPDVFLEKNEFGMKRVLEDNYAFFMESSTIEYYEKQQCGLRRVGGLLDTKGYGIAVRKNSPLRAQLTDAILELQEKEILQKIKKTWWEKGGKSCEDESDQSPQGLTLSNVGGVFVVLLSGMGFACVVALIEFMWNIRNTVKENRGSLCSEMLNELKFVIRCYGSTKPVRKNAVETDNRMLNMNLHGYNGLGSHDT